MILYVQALKTLIIWISLEQFHKQSNKMLGVVMYNHHHLPLQSSPWHLMKEENNWVTNDDKRRHWRCLTMKTEFKTSVISVSSPRQGQLLPKHKHTNPRVSRNDYHKQIWPNVMTFGSLCKWTFKSSGFH